jgi:protein TonB
MSGGSRARFITTGERVGGFVGWAFVIAIAIHATLVPFIRAPGLPEQAPPERATIVTLASPPPPTAPPTPTPPPPRAQRQRPRQNQARFRAPVPQLRNKRAGPPEISVNPTTGPVAGNVVVGPPSAPPIPAATVAACPDPDREARTLSLAPPEYPVSAMQEGAGEREVQVAVTISPVGAVLDESIVQTSGIASIDRDALRVARETTYAPRIEDCRPVLGTYKYVIDYQSG